MTSSMERDTARSGVANGSPQGQQLQDAAGGLIHQAARTADAQASTTMTRVGETIETLANHMRQAGEELRGEQPQVAGLIDTAADRIQGAASYLRDRDASEALDNVQQFARSQPALVIGAGLAAGLLLGRLLRGGAEAARESQSDMGYGGTSRAYGGDGGSYGTSYGRSAGATAYGSSAYGASSYGTGAAAGVGAGTAAARNRLVVEAVAIEDDVLADDELTTDSATGDAVRDEAPTARS